MVVRGLERVNVDVHALCGELGLSYASFVDPDARVACDDLSRLWRLAERRTGDRSLGIRAAERAELVANHVHVHLLLSSRNLRDGITALRRSLATVGHGSQLSMVDEGDVFRLVYVDAHGDLEPSPNAVEFTAGVLRRVWGVAMGGPLPLVAVEFAHPRPCDPAAHERVLGCPVEFARPANAMLVSRDVMLRPSPHWSPELSRQLMRVAHACLEKISQPSLAAELGTLLRSRLPSGPCDADSVAAELHISLRTLQRRLGAENTSYREVLDRARRQVALELLESDLPLNDIAAQCGLSNARTLIRAFHRWTGWTPSAYRKRAGHPARSRRDRPGSHGRSAGPSPSLQWMP